MNCTCCKCIKVLRILRQEQLYYSGPRSFEKDQIWRRSEGLGCLESPSSSNFKGTFFVPFTVIQHNNPLMVNILAPRSVVWLYKSNLFSRHQFSPKEKKTCFHNVVSLCINQFNQNISKAFDGNEMWSQQRMKWKNLKCNFLFKIEKNFKNITTTFSLTRPTRQRWRSTAWPPGPGWRSRWASCRPRPTPPTPGTGASRPRPPVKPCLRHHLGEMYYLDCRTEPTA